MAAIDINKIAGDAFGAMVGVLGERAPNIVEFARSEAAKIAASVVQIGQLRASGVINDAEVALHLDIQKNASRAVLMAAEGMGILAAEQAINAALSVVTKAVGGALGIVIPGA